MFDHRNLLHGQGGGGAGSLLILCNNGISCSGKGHISKDILSLQVDHCNSVPFFWEGTQQHHPLNGVADCHAIGIKSLKEESASAAFLLVDSDPPKFSCAGQPADQHRCCLCLVA